MNIVIIGGGPAGMLAAIAASKSKNNKVLILEKNEKLCKKMFITGKGRCNLTNNCEHDDFFKNIVTNSKFLYSAFSEFDNIDFKKLIEDNGCKLKVERGNRVFPASDKSYDVIDALKKAIKRNNINVFLNTEVLKVNELNDSKKFELIIKNNKSIIADKVIVATGGMSYKSTGSTGDGYKFAKDFDIKVTNLTPSLVPFNVKELDDCKTMQGLTLKNIAIRVIDSNDKIIYKDFGELLFTHFGVSGPTILSASSFVESGEYTLSIDLKPSLNEKQLDQRLIREFENNNKILKNVLSSLLPNSMIGVFIHRLQKLLNDDNVGEMCVSDLNKDLRKVVCNILKDFRFILTSKRGFEEAIITKGGIDVKEINPKTMESKKINGLYFAGEVIDIDALTGGFNIQIAATTGYVAGENAVYDI